MQVQDRSQKNNMLGRELSACGDMLPCSARKLRLGP